MRPRHILGDVDIRERYKTLCEGQSGGASGNGDAREDGMYSCIKIDHPEPIISLKTQEGVTGVVGADASEPSQLETEPLRWMPLY
jgi:hypothetical protein